MKNDQNQFVDENNKASANQNSGDGNYGPNGPASTNITKAQRMHLADNYYKQLMKYDAEGTARNLDKDKDSGAVWISKKDIEDLLSGINDEDGLTIYFIVHDKNMPEPLPAQFDKFHNQLSIAVEPSRQSAQSQSKTSPSICPPATNCFV